MNVFLDSLADTDERAVLPPEPRVPHALRAGGWVLRPLSSTDRSGYGAIFALGVRHELGWRCGKLRVLCWRWRSARHGLRPGMALATVIGLAACGGNTSLSAVVRVGGIAITQSAVEDWTTAFSRGATIWDPFRRAGQTPRQQALGFLISSYWLIGEAADQGMRVSDQAVRRQLEEQKEAEPGGEAAYRESLKATGRTVADVELEVKAKLTAAMIDAMLASKRDAATQAQIADYYKRNTAQFRLPERRDIEIDESFKTAAAARREASRVGSGRAFARIAVPESPQRPSNFNADANKGAVERAIFSAKPGTLIGPMKLNHSYALFVVRRVIPSTVQSFSRVRQAIAEQLTAQEHQTAVDEFAQEYRRKWIAQTNCDQRFLVQGCRQYTGPMMPERNPFANS